MINKPLIEIIETDIEHLVENQVPESKVLDYKAQLNDLRQGSIKKEFLADICSFANSLGGDLIIGIEDSDGVANKVTGVPISELDSLRNQIEQILQSGIAPRVSGVEIKFLLLKNGNYIIIIRIPKSWLAPHMVWFDQTSKFYSRSSAGKYQLDYEEIRLAFYSAQGPQEKMRQFRTNRISAVTEAYFEAMAGKNVGILIHILPISSFTTTQQADLQVAISNPNNIRPIGSNSYNRRYNFDGFFTYLTHYNSPLTATYLQIYRNGCLEYFHNMETTNVPLGHIEGLIAGSLQDTQRLLSSLQVSNTFFFCLTLLNVKNKSASIGQGHSTFANNSYSIILPEIGMDRIEAYTMETLKPAFDVLANAFGLNQSPGYDGENKFKP